MSSKNLIPALGPPPQRMTEADAIVGLGFRCSMACLRVCDGQTHQQARALLAAAVRFNDLPSQLIADFTCWTLAIEATSARPIVVLPPSSPSYCRDECLAIALVAACRNDTCPALHACAAALLGTDDVARTMAATQIVANTLLRVGPRLNGTQPVEATAKPDLAPTPRRWHH